MREILAGNRSQVEVGGCFFQQGERDALTAHRWRGCACRPEPQLVEAGLQLGAEDDRVTAMREQLADAHAAL